MSGLHYVVHRPRNAASPRHLPKASTTGDSRKRPATVASAPAGVVMWIEPAELQSIDTIAGVFT
jgi:hypothetical protein